MSDLTLLPHFLVCPDDHEALHLEGTALRCQACARLFASISGTYWDLRPAKLCQKAREFGKAYFSAYRGLFEREHKDFSAIQAWGAAETAPIAWLKRRKRHRGSVLGLIRSCGDTSRSILADISAGAGFYTIALAPYFRCVFHCDLSVASLTYASTLSQQLGITNIIFLRVDNLALPFQHSLAHLLCLDTLIMGDGHELYLLRQIAAALRSSGSAVVDFHNCGISQSDALVCSRTIFTTIEAIPDAKRRRSSTPLIWAKSGITVSCRKSMQTKSWEES